MKEVLINGEIFLEKEVNEFDCAGCAFYKPTNTEYCFRNKDIKCGEITLLEKRNIIYVRPDN